MIDNIRIRADGLAKLSLGWMIGTPRALHSFQSGQDNFVSKNFEGRHWLLSQMKSGTNYILNTLGFYNSIKSSAMTFDFSNLENYGIFRHATFMDAEAEKLRAFSKINPSLPIAVHSHHFLRMHPRILIAAFRNPYDYAVSAYYYKYRNRVGGNLIDFDSALPNILWRYIKTAKAQSRAASSAEITVWVDYDDLITWPQETMSKVIEAGGCECDQVALAEALRKSSKDSLRKFEEDSGASIHSLQENKLIPKMSRLTSRPMTTSHFVRSGRIGEGSDVLNDAQMRFINFHMKRHHIFEIYSDSQSCRHLKSSRPSGM